MQMLGEALKAKLKRVDFRDPEYIERVLLGMPDTAVVEAALAGLAFEQSGHVENSTAWLRFADLIDKAKLQLERCAQRDMLTAERPAGCWCMGLGGRHRRYTLLEDSFFEQICTACPDGERETAHKARARAEAMSASTARDAMRMFGKAQVPTRFKDCTLDTYPVTKQTRAALEAVLRWINGPGEAASDADYEAWEATRKRSLLLHGLFGVGKTGLAVGILRNRVYESGGGLFFTVPSLLDCIRRTYGPNSVANEHELVEAVKTTPFLVLDDLGAERVTDWVREKLFTIINHRHDEDLPTVFTSNLDIAELGEHIGERTTWRIVEMAEVIHVSGPNLRAQAA